MMVLHFDCKHRCHREKYVSTAFILSSRWQDGAESLGIAVYGTRLRASVETSVAIPTLRK